MISRCVNPACHAEFKLYNSGTLYAHERRGANTEFLWLCAPCAAHLAPSLEPDGSVSVVPRAAVEGSHPPRPDASLRMVGRPMGRLPWRKTVPAGETVPPMLSRPADLPWRRTMPAGETVLFLHNRSADLSGCCDAS